MRFRPLPISPPPVYPVLTPPEALPLRLTCLAVALLAAVPAFAEPFEFKSSDRVILIGGTLIEREQRYGYWEAMLTARHPGIRFRNLGWSGDDVFGVARRAFEVGDANIGRKRLVDLALAEKPTVILICYGANECFEGEAGLGKFHKGYAKLLDELAPAKARIVLLGPPPFAEMPPPLPDLKKQDTNLRIYFESIRSLSSEYKTGLVDLYDAFGRVEGMRGMTDNGIHMTDVGYARSAGNFLRAFGLKVEGGYTPDLEPLRTAIRKKNELYFYRWRPQNETYLFGFRKHEQGKNGKEVAEFDPLVAAAEAEIDKILKGKN
jgi:lysophospholipase L1-like esterase